MYVQDERGVAPGRVEGLGLLLALVALLAHGHHAVGIRRLVICVVGLDWIGWLVPQQCVK